MKLDNKGMAISGILYSILVLFIVLVFGVLSVLASTKFSFDKFRKDIMQQLSLNQINKGEWVYTDNNSNGIIDVGDEIKIGTESFYIISYNGVGIKAIAKYNLFVGGEYSNDEWTEYGIEATLLQDKNMKGYVEGEDHRYGTIDYSTDTVKGINYSDYSGSLVESYVNAYKLKLEDMGATLKDISLISKTELQKLGCNQEAESCADAPAFVTSSSFWSATPDSTTEIWSVSAGGFFYIDEYNNGKEFNGIRPVITIMKSDIGEMETCPYSKGKIWNFDYTGDVQELPILCSGTYKLETWGAQGGYRSTSTYGGLGGYSIGTILLESQDELNVYVGGSGNTGGSSGGFNGGGKREKHNGGGGATDIRINSTSLLSRVIVAGGGGSDGATNKSGMYGGGASGGSSTQSYGSYGYGGTQTGNNGGSSYITTTQTTNYTTSTSSYSGFGFGGNGISLSSGYGGAGGGGWYGGTGAVPDGSGDDDSGGGGGSGYIYTSETSSSYPSGCLLKNKYYLTDAQTIAGNVSFLSPNGNNETGHSGNGYARVTFLSLKE